MRDKQLQKHYLLITSQVFKSNNSSHFLDVLDQQRRQTSGVKRISSFVDDRTQTFGQFGSEEQIALLQQIPILVRKNLSLKILIYFKHRIAKFQ